MRKKIFAWLLMAAIGAFFMTACDDEEKYYYSEQSDYNGNNNNSISAPTGVSATLDEDNDIFVTWNSVSNAVRYNVYYSTESSGSYSNIGYVTENYCYITNPSPGYNYIKVTAVSSNGYESGMSAYAYCYVTYSGGGNSGGGNNGGGSSGGGNNEGGNGGGSSVSKPSAPTGVSVSNEGAQWAPIVRIRWNTVSGATSYKVYKGTSANGSYSLIGTSYYDYYDDDNAPTNGRGAYYKVKAVNSAGESDYSSYAHYQSISDDDAYSPGIHYGNCTVSGNTMTLRWEHLTGWGYGRATSCTLRVYDPYAEIYRDTELSPTATSTSFNFSDKIDNDGFVRAGIIVANGKGSFTPGAKVYDTKNKRFLN